MSGLVDAPVTDLSLQWLCATRTTALAAGRLTGLSTRPATARLCCACTGDRRNATSWFMTHKPPTGGGSSPLAESSAAAIEVRALIKTYSNHTVLRGVNLVVPQGTTVVILGGSGQGKSVLMKHLIGLEKPDAGQVFINGRDIVPMSDRQLNDVRNEFGMVFQNAALFDSMSVFDNVAFPLREHTKLSETEIRQRVENTLGLFNLDPRAFHKFPAQISGGMRKRVGLARAVIRQPKIVLYDEPTTGLDPLTTEAVDEMILHAKRSLNVTSVVISHDIGSAFKIADTLAFLHAGEVIEAGTPGAFRNSKRPEVQRFLSMWFSKN
jgi:phospholipid/cholesterol/gamma-HCH transport system ATP-binding protein